MFLKRLLLEIEAVDIDVIGPRKEVEKGEEAIGIMSDDSKRFYLVLMRLEHQISGRADKNRYRSISELFRLHLEEEFPKLIGYKGEIGYRKGWIVVTVPSIFDYFKNIGSGGLFRM